MAYSNNGYSDWREYAPDMRLIDQQCFGSCVNGNRGGKTYILFTNCAAENERKAVAVKLSVDDGKTRTYEKPIDSERGGYVEIAANDDLSEVYCLYEENFGQTMHFVTFNLEWLMGK